MGLSIQSTAVEYKVGNMISFKKSNKYECCLCSKKNNVFDVTVVDKDKKVVIFYNGTATHETQEIPEGGKATKPATDPVKDGAEFKHWGTSEDAEEAS